MEPPELDEMQLMLQARRDVACFVPLYERYVGRIYAYCRRRVASDQDAEDLTSQVFTRALSNIDSYRGGMVSAWLFQIAAHSVVDYLRARRPETSIETLDLPEETAPPIEGMIQDEQQRVIRRLVSTLPSEQQEMLWLKMNGGLNAQEISAVLGKNPGTIRSTIHRTLRHLYKVYRQLEREDQS